MSRPPERCLTCMQSATVEDFHVANLPPFGEVLRKHLWFTEAELTTAVICTGCWLNVDSFHQFYVAVEKLYEFKQQPVLPPESVTVKVEELDELMAEELESETDELMVKSEEQSEPEEPPEDEQEVPSEAEDQSEDEDTSSEIDDEEDDSPSPRIEDPDEFIRRHIALKCEDCGDDSFTFKELFVHTETVHAKKISFVTCCGTRYFQRFALVEHVQFVFDPDAFACNRCQVKCPNGTSLRKHMRVRHRIGQTRKYNNSNRLSKDKPAPTERAEEKLKKRKELDQLREKRSEDDKVLLQHTKFECVPCGESFQTYAAMYSHCRKTHRKKPVVTCCGIRFHNRSKLWQHVQSVLNPAAYQCDLCFRRFKNEYGRDKHRKEMHATEEDLKWRCDRCPKAFVREIKYRHHMRDHEDADAGRIKCEHCGKVYSSRVVLYMHVRKKHQEPRYVCDVCAKPFHQKAEFDQHKLQHEDPDKLKMQCQYCLKWFKNREYWRTHIRLIHTRVEVKCDICGRMCPNRRALGAHVRNAHGEPNKECDWCGKCFKKDINLREHIASIHTGDVLYTCRFCPKTFNSNANMHSHRRKMHPVEWLAARSGRNGAPGVVAESATEYYTTRAVLYTHIRNYHREPELVCDICAKAFRLKSEFERHKLMHENPDKLKMQCPHCLKWYKTRENWRAHVRSHKATPVTCELCDRVCPNKNALYAHKKQAHLTAQLECDWCGKLFKKELNLREHIASIHTGDVLYTCTFCPRTFNSNANMFSHRRKMHPVEWAEAKRSSDMARVPKEVAAGKDA